MGSSLPTGYPWGKIAPFKDADGNDLFYAPPAD
jgi:hypothetical protein